MTSSEALTTTHKGDHQVTIYQHTDDDDGDSLHVESFTDRTDAVVSISDEDGDRMYASLTKDAARFLATWLTEFAGEPEPYATGDRVEVFGYPAESWNGPATVDVVTGHPEYPMIHVRPDAGQWAGTAGAFSPASIRPYTDPKPDYNAKAVTFKLGDTAIVGDAPSTTAQSTGGVNSDYAARAVTVVEEADTAIVRVQWSDNHPQYIHVAHLTRIVGEQW